MSSRPRIGELLLVKELVEPHVLANVLKRAAASRQRLVSQLIAWGMLDADEGAMALAEQLGCHAAMQRHLERRDPAVARVIPDALCARWVVLPLGRASNGSLVVVARDPTPILSAALEHAVKSRIVLAVTPAAQLERILRSTYGMAGAPDEPLPHEPPSVSEIGDAVLDPLAEPEQPAPRPRTVSRVMYDHIELPPQRARTPTGRPVDPTLVELAQARSRAAAEHHAMAYVAARWHTGLLLEIGEHVALGRRGVGAKLASVEHLMIPTAAPSIVKAAFETSDATTQAPDSEVQHRLAELLEHPRTPAAAAVLEGDRVAAVLVVGDPKLGGAREALADLDRLAGALGAAYTRLGR